MSGIRRSSRTTSGRSRSIASSAASPAFGFADQLEAAVEPDRAAHAASEHGTVVDDQDADGAGAAGRLAQLTPSSRRSGIASQSLRPRLPPR